MFYLPGVCTHTDTEGKQSPEYLQKFGKHTIFNKHPVEERLVPEYYCVSLVSIEKKIFRFYHFLVVQASYKRLCTSNAVI